MLEILPNTILISRASDICKHLNFTDSWWDPLYSALLDVQLVKRFGHPPKNTSHTQELTSLSFLIQGWPLSSRVPQVLLGWGRTREVVQGGRKGTSCPQLCWTSLSPGAQSLFPAPWTLKQEPQTRLVSLTWAGMGILLTTAESLTSQELIPFWFPPGSCCSLIHTLLLELLFLASDRELCDKLHQEFQVGEDPGVPPTHNRYSSGWTLSKLPFPKYCTDISVLRKILALPPTDSQSCNSSSILTCINVL